MVPLNINDLFWDKTAFWVGLFFVMFPLNYLVYGLNDYNDVASDRLNDRKGNFLFGAKASPKHLKSVPGKIAIVLAPFIFYFVYKAGFTMLILLITMIIFNIIYNFRPFRIKERPPFEIIMQAGYVLTAIFSVILNGMEMLPWQTIVYLTLFAFQAHIAGEIMDIEPDLLSHKKTTATLLGRKRSKYLMLVLLILEVYILSVWFGDYILAAFLGGFSIWLLLDVFLFFKGEPYTVKQMKIFGFGMNMVAFTTMVWVLYSGKLLDPVF